MNRTMHTILLLSVVLTLTTSAASAAETAASARIHGAWTITGDDRGKLYLSISRAGSMGHYGDSMQLQNYEGLSQAQIQSATQVPVQFRTVSDAGVISFDGTFRNGDGAGQFSFAPNAGYFDKVRALGVTVDRPGPRSKETEEDALFRLTFVGVTLPYLREMHGVFPEAGLHELTSLRAVNVTTRYLNEMRAVGVNIESSRDAKKLAALGVTPDYVRELAQAGYKNLPVRQLVKLRATGVNAKFIRDMQNVH